MILCWVRLTEEKRLATNKIVSNTWHQTAIDLFCHKFNMIPLCYLHFTIRFFWFNLILCMLLDVTVTLHTKKNQALFYNIR